MKKKRILATSGYLVLYLPRHHLAHRNGYAYVHRLVAEMKVGRALLPGEVVHHVNGLTTDNSLGNLIVMPSRWHHKVIHRSPGAVLRCPEEPNPQIQCSCGCGGKLLAYDTRGRARRRIYGHVARK